jgi:hypothetical protein
MFRFVLALIFSRTLACHVQQGNPEQSAIRSDLEPALTFEAPPSAHMPGGWNGTPVETISLDDKVVHGGTRFCPLERKFQFGE